MILSCRAPGRRPTLAAASALRELISLRPSRLHFRPGNLFRPHSAPPSSSSIHRAPAVCIRCAIGRPAGRLDTRPLARPVAGQAEAQWRGPLLTVQFVVGARVRAETFFLARAHTHTLESGARTRVTLINCCCCCCVVVAAARPPNGHKSATFVHETFFFLFVAHLTSRCRRRGRRRKNDFCSSSDLRPGQAKRARSLTRSLAHNHSEAPAVAS